MPFCIVSAAAEIGMLPGMDDSTLVSPFDSTLDTPTTVRAHLQAGSDRMLPDEFHRNDRSAYLKCSNSHPDMNHGRGVIPGTTHPALETKTLIDARDRAAAASASPSVGSPPFRPLAPVLLPPFRCFGRRLRQAA